MPAHKIYYNTIKQQPRYLFIIRQIISSNIWLLLLASLTCNLSLFGWFLIDNIEHLSLQGFLVGDKSILIPYKLRSFWINIILLHAPFKQINYVFVIWVLGESKTPAVLHELEEYIWATFAKLL